MMNKELKMKEKFGALAFFLGLVGCASAAGADPVTLQDWFTVAGVAVTSLMLAQVGVWMIKDEI